MNNLRMRAKERNPNRIKEAWAAGFSAGRHWSGHCISLPRDYRKMCPYTTFWPGVQCFVAWSIGFKMGMQLRGIPVEDPFMLGARKSQGMAL